MPSEFHPFSIDLPVRFQEPEASSKELTAKHRAELAPHAKHRLDTSQYTKDSRRIEMRQQSQVAFCVFATLGYSQEAKVLQMDNGKYTNHNRYNPVQ